ncbi:MAG: CaiB/BaiF CoA transferase family protein [Syntrophobacteraceae bacterium]
MNFMNWARENTHPDTAGWKPEALADVVVLDLSFGSFAGLFASSLLSELGARVIRVEPPGGDIARKMSPFGESINGTGLPYLIEGRNKEHITLDVRQPKGREILKHFVRKADVLIETSAPGAMEEMGIGRRVLCEVNPRLIHVAMNSYGQAGELSELAGKSNWKCYDVIAQALSGFCSTTGIPERMVEYPEHARVPTRLGIWIGWVAGGAFAGLSAMVALFFREFSGRGQSIDVSPAEALMSLNNYHLHLYHLTGQVLERPGNMEPAMHPYCYVRCKDGLIFIAGHADLNWKALCAVIDRPDLVEAYPGLKDRTDPVKAVEIVRELEKFTLERTREELVSLWLAYKGGPGVTVAGEVLTPIEAMELDYWYERKSLIKVKEEPWGELLLQGPAVKMSETPPRIKWVCREVGADNEFVYLDFMGCSRKRLDELKAEGVV